MKTYDLKQDSLVVFPTTYAFKLLKKENNSVTEETKDFYASEELKKVQEKLLKETVKNFFATYHFYSCISTNIEKRDYMRSLLKGDSNPLADYDGNVKATMLTVDKITRDLYLNLLDLRLVNYLINREDAFVGYSVVEAGEVCFKELFDQLNETELNFKEDKYPENFTKFVNEVIYKLKYALNDKPMDISNKKLEDEMLITRYHEVLKTIVDSLVSITGEKDYYSDIIEAEESVISNKS
jgi:hypothetical protein